jgi:hypothetical protein
LRALDRAKIDVPSNPTLLKPVDQKAALPEAKSQGEEEILKAKRMQRLRLNNAQMIGENEIEKIYQRLNSYEHVILPFKVNNEVKEIISSIHKK